MLAIAPLAATLAIGFQEAPAPFPKDLIHWRPIAANPVFTGELDDPSAWDHQIRERGWIAIEDGTYHLWYTGYRDADSRRVLGHATSTDGVDWVRDPANPVHDSSWVEDMCVVRDGGTLWMFAEGELDIAHLLSSSDDGESWTERGPLKIRQVDGTPIPPGPRGTPTVWVEDGVWSLFYERGDLSVWLARSDDPAHLVWNKCSRRTGPGSRAGSLRLRGGRGESGRQARRCLLLDLSRQFPASLGRLDDLLGPLGPTWSIGRNIRATR